MKVIVVGAGEIGRHVAFRLAEEQQEVTVVDAEKSRIEEMREHIDASFVVGNGASPEVLKEAGIQSCEMLVAATSSDEINVVSCLMAELQTPGCITIARVRDPDFQKNRELFYRKPLSLDLFINPEVEAAERILRILRLPMAEDIQEFAGGQVHLIAFRVDEGSPLANLRLKDLATTGLKVLLAGIRRDRRWIIPRGDDKVLPGDVIYISSPIEHEGEVVKALGKSYRPARNVMIYGGTNVGYYLARRLESREIHVKVIEPDRARCEFLADNLPRSVVLNGRGLDEDLLAEENVGSMDAFVALTNNEEDNLISALLAKSMGAAMTITLTNKASYARMIRSLGVDAAVSPQVEAVGAIMQYIRRGKVMRVAAMREGRAEALEFEALATADAVGRPLMEISFPRGALIMAVVRGDEVIIPTGKTVIEPRDRVLVFCLKEALDELQRIFSVKLSFID